MGANIQGYNSDAGIIRAEVAREEARRPTSNAPSNLTQDSLSVVVKRVCLLLLGKTHTPSLEVIVVLMILLTRHNPR